MHYYSLSGRRADRFLTFIQTPSYANAAKGLLNADLQREIELAICADPRCGELEAGVRKLRVHLPGRGKRGGARVIYYYTEAKGRVYLLDVFAKNMKLALSASEKNQVRKLTKMLAEE